MRLSRVVKFDRCWEERRSTSLKRTKRMSSCTLTVLVAIFMALICPQVQSFAPRSSPSLQKRSVTRSHSTHLKMAVVPPGVAAVAAAPIMYGLMSINEYMTHRWYQHAEISKVGWWKALRMPKVKGGGHVEHHAETLDDMVSTSFCESGSCVLACSLDRKGRPCDSAMARPLFMMQDDAFANPSFSFVASNDIPDTIHYYLQTLKMDEKWKNTPAAKSLDSDAYRGTGFTWMTSFIMMIQMCISVIPIYTMGLGFTLSSTFAMLLPAMFLHALVWNALHPNMHGLPDMPAREGAPSSWMAGLRDSAYFKYLYQNHEGHHVAGGQANYNVCCPGTDHLLGTYMSQAQWRPRQEASIAKMNKPVTDPVLA